MYKTSREPISCYFLFYVLFYFIVSYQFSCVCLCLALSSLSSSASLTFLHSFQSSPRSLCFPVTWPRTHLFVTVIWSGLQTTCAPTPSRPAVPAAPALAASQTNALDRSRARNSAAPVGRWLSVTVFRCLPLISLLGSLSLRQALLFLVHLSLSLLYYSTSLLLSAGSGYYLCIVPSNSYHI